MSRKRILDSAAKVMELYASSRAVLELEFFGEVRGVIALACYDML